MVDWSLVMAGAGTGFVVGLTGVGGGALMTPVLLLFFGIAPVVAIGTDLWFAAITKTVATRVHRHSGLIDWQVVKRLWLGSLPASACLIIGLSSAPRHELGSGLLREAVAIAVCFSAGAMLFQSQLYSLSQRAPATTAARLQRLQVPSTVFVGVVLGLLVTLTSVGAGALGAAFLLYLYPLRLTPPRLIATDIAQAIPLAVVAGFGQLLAGHVDFRLLASLLVGSIPAVVVGALLSSRLPHAVLRVLLAAVLMMIGIRLM